MSNYPEARKFTYYHLSNFLLSVTNNEQLLDDEGLQSKQNDTNCKEKRNFTGGFLIEYVANLQY